MAGPSLASDVQGCTNIVIAGARERVFYIVRRAPRGAIYGVAHSRSYAPASATY